jgi:hypothetical protein
MWTFVFLSYPISHKSYHAVLQYLKMRRHVGGSTRLLLDVPNIKNGVCDHIAISLKRNYANVAQSRLERLIYYGTIFRA